MEAEENLVWKGRSSQIINFLPFVISLLIAVTLHRPSFLLLPFHCDRSPHSARLCRLDLAEH